MPLLENLINMRYTGISQGIKCTFIFLKASFVSLNRTTSEKIKKNVIFKKKLQALDLLRLLSLKE